MTQLIVCPSRGGGTVGSTEYDHSLPSLLTPGSPPKGGDNITPSMTTVFRRCSLSEGPKRVGICTVSADRWGHEATIWYGLIGGGPGSVANSGMGSLRPANNKCAQQIYTDRIRHRARQVRKSARHLQLQKTNYSGIHILAI